MVGVAGSHPSWFQMHLQRFTFSPVDPTVIPEAGVRGFTQLGPNSRREFPADGRKGVEMKILSWRCLGNNGLPCQYGPG